MELGIEFSTSYRYVFMSVLKVGALKAKSVNCIVYRHVLCKRVMFVVKKALVKSVRV